MEGPSKSLTISPGINPIARNRWSSYEPVDFGKLSACNKTNNPPTELNSKDPVGPSQDTSSDTRCFSHEFVIKAENNPHSTETFREKEADCSADQRPLSDVALGEKMKQIDEKLDAALKDRRVLLEKILKTPSKSFLGRPGLRPLLFESFLSSETLTKLVSHSMNSPGNAVTSEDMKVLKQTVLDLQRNLTLISEMICSDRNDKSDLRSSSSSSLAKDSDGTCDERQHPMEILSANDIQTEERVPTTDASTGTTEYWPTLEKAPSLLPVESDDEVDEVLSKIDEENEDTSTLDRNSPPIVPLETHPLNRDLRLSLGHPVTFLEDDLPQPAEASKLGFRNEKTFNSNIRKSSSTTCFPESRIHLSIAEEDEETLCDEDAFNEQSSIVDKVCPSEPPKSAENVSVDAEETIDDVGKTIDNYTKTIDDVAETIKPLNAEERDSTFAKPDRGSFENKVNEQNAFNEKILFQGEVDGGEEQELQPCLTTVSDTASEAKLKNSYCELASSVENRITSEEKEHRVENRGGREGIDADRNCEAIKFVNERQANVVEVSLLIIDEVEPLLSNLSITKDSDSLHRTDDPNVMPAISDDETVKKEDFKITDNNSHGAIGAFRCTKPSNCGGKCCSQTLLTVEEVLHKPPKVEELQETVQNVEVFATVTEVTNEVIECLPREELLTIMEASKIEIVEEHEAEELKVENVEVLVCNEERLDSLGSNEDASDTSTPANSDTCEPSQEMHQEGSNQNKEEGVVEISQVPLPSSNKNSNNKKRRNKKKKKNQQQQQTNNSHEKDSKNIKETSLADNKEAIVAASR